MKLEEDRNWLYTVTVPVEDWDTIRLLALDNISSQTVLH